MNLGNFVEQIILSPYKIVLDVHPIGYILSEAHLYFVLMGNVAVENLKILGEGLGAGLLGLSNVHYLLGILLFHLGLIFNFISCSVSYGMVLPPEKEVNLFQINCIAKT